MWAFKTLHDKGLVYEGFRVLAYCWRCETPLSNTETRMDDVYRDRHDPTLTVWFELAPTDTEPALKLGVWTTTPWTLPSNLALAVGPDIEYAVLERDGERYIVGAARLAAYAKELEGYERVGTVHGRDLVGRRYTPLFDFLAEQAGPNAYQVLGGGLRHHRGRHRDRPPRPGLRRGRPERLQRRRHPDRRHRRRPHPLHRAGPAVRRGCRSSTPTSRSSAT